MSESPDLNVCSVVTSVNDKPYIQITLGNSKGVLSVIDARTRGMTLLTAAAIAEAEARIFELFVPPSKGFNPSEPDKKVKQAILTLREARKRRLPLPPDIDPIYGFDNREPLIQYKWGSDQCLLDLDAARDHAKGLIEAAESAERDSFFYYFFTSKHEILTRAQTEEFLQELQTARAQNILEKLFES